MIPLEKKLRIGFEHNPNAHVREAVLIANNHAIDFAEWCIRWGVELIDDTQSEAIYCYGGMGDKKYTMRELITIFNERLL